MSSHYHVPLWFTCLTKLSACFEHFSVKHQLLADCFPTILFWLPLFKAGSSWFFFSFTLVPELSWGHYTELLTFSKSAPGSIGHSPSLHVCLFQRSVFLWFNYFPWHGSWLYLIPGFIYSKFGNLFAKKGPFQEFYFKNSTKLYFVSFHHNL